jgi:hypothetical protein
MNINTKNKSVKKQVTCSVFRCRGKATNGEFCKKHFTEQNNHEYVDLNLAKQAKDTALKELAETKAAQEAAKKLDGDKEEVSSAIEQVMRITELEAMTFRALEAEVKVADLTVKNAQHEKLVADRNMEREIVRHQKLQAERQQQIDRLGNEFNMVRDCYLKMVSGLAERYGLNPSEMAIDPDSRVIRDLREKTGETSVQPGQNKFKASG